MVKRKTMLSLEGWYYLAVLGFIVGGAVIRQINLLMVVAGMMMGPLLVSWWLVRRTLYRVEARRSVAKGVGATELLVIELSITNHRRRLPAWGVIIDDMVRRQDASDRSSRFRVRLFVPFLRPGETREVTYHGRLQARGRYKIGPVRLSTRFPLGLVRRTVVDGEPDFVYIYPRLGKLTHTWHQVVQPGRIGAQSTQQRRGLVEGEFHGLRDWRNGDSQRWIHWRTSAKRNSLTVKQFERQRNQDVAILVALRQLDHEDTAAAERVEKAVRFAATVISHYCRRGSSRVTLGLSTGDQVELVGGVTSAALLQSAMEKLAVAQASRKDTLPSLLDYALRELAPDVRIVIISTDPVDLSDTDRFEAVWQDPRKRALLSRIVCLPVGSSEFASCFDDSLVEGGARR